MDNSTSVGTGIFSNETADRKFTEDINELSQLIYGIILPVVVAIGTFGSVVNLVVLSRPLLQATPYMFARWRSVSDLLALISFVPFLIRMKESTRIWDSYWIAFYYGKVQLLVSNSLVGVSTLYVTAFSIERYLFVSKPLKMHFDSKNKMKTLISLIVIPIVIPFLQLPYFFRTVIEHKYNRATNSTVYTYYDDEKISNLPLFKVYALMLQSVLRIGPVIAVASLNICIFVEYRKIMKRRTQLRKTDSSEQKRKEEKRLLLLLGGTSLAFFVCTSPAAVLSLTIRDDLELNFDYQIFRAISNTLEITNCALPVIIYTTIAADFRKTLVGFFWKPKK